VSNDVGGPKRSDDVLKQILHAVGHMVAQGLLQPPFGGLPKGGHCEMLASLHWQNCTAEIMGPRNFSMGWAALVFALQTQLMTADAFVWSEECDVAFAGVKHALCDAPC